MGETGFCKNLRFSAVSCENLRFPAVFYANLRLPNPLIYRAKPKISENLQKSAKMCGSGSGFSLLLSPFLARPDSSDALHIVRGDGNGVLYQVGMNGDTFSIKGTKGMF